MTHDTTFSDSSRTLPMMDESSRSELWFSPENNKRPDSTPFPVRTQSNLPVPSPSTNEELYSTTPEKTRILIWNSNIKEAKLIQENLYLAGYTSAYCATTYNDGLLYLQKHLVHVFLIDTHLGEIGGLELAKALRDSNTYRHTPILMVAPTHRIEDMLNAMKAGANDLMASPLTPDLLSQKISLYLKISTFS